MCVRHPVRRYCHQCDEPIFENPRYVRYFYCEDSPEEHVACDDLQDGPLRRESGMYSCYGCDVNSARQELPGITPLGAEAVAEHVQLIMGLDRLSVAERLWREQLDDEVEDDEDDEIHWDEDNGLTLIVEGQPAGMVHPHEEFDDLVNPEDDDDIDDDEYDAGYVPLSHGGQGSNNAPDDGPNVHTNGINGYH